MGSGGWPPGEIFKDTSFRNPKKPPLHYTIKIGVFFAASLLPCEGMQFPYKLLSYLLGGHTPIPSAVLATCSYIPDN